VSNLRNKTANALLALGFDTDLITKVETNRDTVSSLRSRSDTALRLYYTDAEVQLIKDYIKRKPIATDVLVRVLAAANESCCFCEDGNSARPYQIHHIIEHAKTQDNSEENLVLICPSHHVSVPKQFSAAEQKERRRTWHSIVKIARAYRTEAWTIRLDCSQPRIMDLIHTLKNSLPIIVCLRALHLPFPTINWLAKLLRVCKPTNFY
jgi:hypothetical protein